MREDCRGRLPEGLPIGDADCTTGGDIHVRSVIHTVGPERAHERLFGIERFVAPPNTLGARPHIHCDHDEYFYVLDSELTVDPAQL